MHQLPRRSQKTAHQYFPIVKNKTQRYWRKKRKRIKAIPSAYVYPLLTDSISNRSNKHEHIIATRSSGSLNTHVTFTLSRIQKQHHAGQQGLSLTHDDWSGTHSKRTSYIDDYRRWWPKDRWSRAEWWILMSKSHSFLINVQSNTYMTLIDGPHNPPPPLKKKHIHNGRSKQTPSILPIR